MHDINIDKPVWCTNCMKPSELVEYLCSEELVDSHDEVRIQGEIECPNCLLKVSFFSRAPWHYQFGHAYHHSDFETEYELETKSKLNDLFPTGKLSSIFKQVED